MFEIGSSLRAARELQGLELSKVEQATHIRSRYLAARDRCWISVRLDSAVGRRLYERTLERGDSVRFVARRLWIRIGAPWNLAARLNGSLSSYPLRSRA